jgi:AraC-like DNA-binding protein
MLCNYSVNNLNEFICSKVSDKHFNLCFPHQAGSMNCEKAIINDNIFLFKSDAKANKDLSIQSNYEVKGLIINIILDGSISHKDNQSNKTEIFNKNSAYIKYINSCESNIFLEKKQTSKGIGIIIRDDFLHENLFSSYNKYESIQNNYEQNIVTNIQNTLNDTKNINLASDIYNSPFNGKLNTVYLQSKVYEIIYNKFNTILHQNNLKKNELVKLTQEDIQALHKARDIILTTCDFPDLSTLAKQVTINEFKLKYGFNKLFNTSPGSMILEQKMFHAKELLLKSEFSIKEISEFVGYKHQQSFSSAFLKFFGKRPKDLMTTRKYYY